MHWYALRSKPNKEMALWREVCARDVECFYPKVHVRPVNPRSRTVRPYFPGYLFLYADLEQIGFSTIQWMPFSMGLVSFDGEPAKVPDGLIGAIRHRVGELEAVGREPFDGPKTGDQITIQAGPFAGCEAIFEAHLPDMERVRVLLTLLSKQQLPLELPAGQIQRKRQPAINRSW